jgi:pimeloyl-ACP methyl ester carboxylesterase
VQGSKLKATSGREPHIHPNTLRWRLRRVREMGFAEVPVPVQMWHGRQDRFVPFQHGQWPAGHIPGVDAHLTETDGQLTLGHRVPEVHAWLLQHD